MKYKDYYNFELGNRDIYSHNDILGMTVSDLFKNELPLAYQYNTIGVPKDEELQASPNTHQYTDANGKLRWRSSSKTTEELLEEERQRRAAQEAQTASTQSQLGAMAGNLAPVNNTPTPQVSASPITESEPLLNNASIQAMGGLINKAKEKFQNRQITGHETIRDSINDVVLSERPKTLQSPIQSSIEDLLNGESATDAISDAILKSTPNDENLFESSGSDIKNGWQSLINSGQNIPLVNELENISMPQGDLVQPILEQYQMDDEEGVPTGGAAPIDRQKENPLAKQNNDDFFEAERKNKSAWLMRKNGTMNENRPDAKLFMDIALTHPKNVPSCKDYYFLSSKNVPALNKGLKLEGNKVIPDEYDGFKFSSDSPTAQRLNSSEEFKSQIFSPKNYDSETNTFKSDKLEIELKDDKNLGYSFGHMTVINPKITEDGYVEGLAYDMYNYEHKKLEDFNGNSTTLFYNNSAEALQRIRHLKPYFILVPVKVKI